MDRSLRQLGAILLVSALIFAGGAALAADPGFISGSTGNDGAFNPTCSPTPCTVTVALPPSGIFNFSTITIPANTTVIFTKNAANTPAILLATESVTISGTLRLVGGVGGDLGRPGPGGPGGFDGGPGADGVTLIYAGTGLGPGGGNAATSGASCGGSGASYATAGVVGTNCSPAPTVAPTYGSPALRPIIGGSGGAGGSAYTLPGSAGGAGGGGGGALVIASSGTLTLNSTGQILADGGAGSDGNGGNAQGGGGGSGGAIRLIATTISSSGFLYARGGYPGYAGGTGGLGRIRLEAYTLTVSGTRSPEATQGLPQSVFPAAGQPTLTITSVAGVTAPASPSGSFLTTPDILLPGGTTNPLAVVVSAVNVPLGTTIQVTATPQSGPKKTATSTGLAGTFVNSTATASLNEVSLTQINVLTASATFPLVAFSAGPGPLYAADEEVTHVRVAAVLGGPSTVTYLTRTGREVALP